MTQKEPTPELGSPSEDLKREFGDLIEANVPEGQEARSFMHPDGRKLTLCRPEIIDKESGETDGIYSIIVNEEGVRGDGTKWYDETLYNYDTVDDILEKHSDLFSNMFHPRDLTEEEIGADKKIHADRPILEEGLRVRGYSEEEIANSVDAEILKRRSDDPVVGSALLRGLQQFTEGRKVEEETGLNRVTGSELRNLLDDIRTAIAATPPDSEIE